MDPARWQKLSPLLDALLEMDPALREEHLAVLRREDAALADELAALIAMEAGDQGFLAEPVVEMPLGAHPGRRIGPYLLERMLGEGGMGQVWLARRADGLYERRVALKLLRPGLADPNITLRFVRERQILARLTHPHIARLLDAGIDQDGKPYLALEYVDGQPLVGWCQERALSVPARLDLFRQVCDAVSHAHANLVVHRDLKPTNILVTPNGNVRLLDFGIAKLLDNQDVPLPEQTRTGMRTFTLHYAAPEQIRGEPVTTMTDVYSLGVVLYELLCGSRPYRLKRQTDAEWEEAILDGEPVRPSSAVARADPGMVQPYTPAKLARLLAGDLDRIVLKALAKRPEQRYASVEALSQDLQRYLRGQPVLARGHGLRYRAHKYVARHRWQIVAAVLVVAAMLGTLGIVNWQARQAVREGARAQAMRDFIGSLLEDAEGRGRGRPLDVRGLLDLSARRGTRALAGQPEAHAELIGILARVRLRLGDYATAAELLQQQAALLARVDNPPNGLRLEAAVLNGATQRQLGQARACLAAMQPLAVTAEREASLLPAQVAEFKSELGRCQRDAGNANLARRLFMEALALHRDVLHDAPGVAESLANLAVLRSGSGRTTEAIAEMRAAIAQLEGRGGGKHPLMVHMQRQLCAWEREVGHTALAETACVHALQLSLALHGEDNAATTDSRQQLGALYVDAGRLQEADMQFRLSSGPVERRMGPGHPQLARLYNSMAVVAWERGDMATADRMIQQAIEILRRGDNHTLLSALLFNRGLMLHSVGRDALAREVLDESRAIRVRNVTRPDDPMVANSEFLLGEVEWTLGNPAGLARLRSAEQRLRLHHGPGHPTARRARLSLGRALVAAGDPQGIAILREQAALPAAEGEDRKLGWQAQAYLAAAECSGARAPSLATLDALLAQIHARRPQGGVLEREVRGLREACAGGATRATAAAAAQ